MFNKKIKINALIKGHFGHHGAKGQVLKHPPPPPLHVPVQEQFPRFINSPLDTVRAHYFDEDIRALHAIPRVRVQSEVYFSVLPSKYSPVQSFITSSFPSANTKPHRSFKFSCMFVFVLLTSCWNHCRSFWSNPHTCVLSHDVQVSVLHCWFIDLHALLKQVMYACHWFLVFSHAQTPPLSIPESQS